MNIEYDTNTINKFNEKYNNFWLVNEYDGYNFELYLSKHIITNTQYSYGGIIENDIINLSFQDEYITKIAINSDLLIEFEY